MSQETPADRLAAVHDRIARACAAAGRGAEDVRLVAVSKGHGPDAVTAVATAGQQVFGESRVQEAIAKFPGCPDGLEWHLVGHLQRNKARDAATLFGMVHSVDSEGLVVALADGVAHASGPGGEPLAVLLQVNISGDPAKFGAAPEGAARLLEVALARRELAVRGLMTVPAYTDDPREARATYMRLAELRDELAAAHGVGLPELSMGMSHDMEDAIQEGATIVRVGTAIFGGRG